MSALRTLATIAPWLTAFFIMEAPTALAQDADAKVCPGGKPQYAPFDGLTASFDSVRDASGQGATRVVDCVEIKGASHEYYVDWPDTNIRDTFAMSGRLSAAETFSETTTLQPSSLFLGADRSQFGAGIFREATLREALSGVVKSWISSFHGAASTVSAERPIPQRLEKLRTIDVEVRLDVDGSVAKLTVTNRGENPGGELRFRVPQEVRGANADAPADAQLGKATVVTYAVDQKTATVRHIPLVLLNSDRQVVGAIPAAVASSQ